MIFQCIAIFQTSHVITRLKKWPIAIIPVTHNSIKMDTRPTLNVHKVFISRSIFNAMKIHFTNMTRMNYWESLWPKGEIIITPFLSAWKKKKNPFQFSIYINFFYCKQLEVQPGLMRTSKMESFATVVNGYSH